MKQDHSQKPRIGLVRTVSRIDCVALLGTASFLAMTPAYAQDARSSASAQSARSNDQAGDILVTARRRAESLTEVPASVTAYSSDFIARQNIQSFEDYATKIPNLTFQNGAAASNEGRAGITGGRATIIRGIAGENTTAYYIDDTPVPQSVSPSVLSLDRIEVLKGPQGTLFGASSMGGNLRFITRQPSLTEDSLAMQIQGSKTGEAKGLDFDGSVRGSVVLVPDQLSFRGSLRYQHDGGFITRRVPDSSGGFTSDNQGALDLYAAEFALRAQFSDNFEATLKGFGQISRYDGYPAPYVTARNDYQITTLTNTRLRDVKEYSKDRWGVAALTLNYTGDKFNIVSSTSYFSRRIEEREDVTEGTVWYIATQYNTNLGIPAFPNLTYKDRNRFNQEVRLSFDKGAILPNLSGVVGVYYQNENLKFTQPGQFVPELTSIYAPGYVRNAVTPSHQQDYAVFGELYYDIVPKLTVTIGARQYWVNQKVDSYTTTGFVRPAGATFPELKVKQSGVVPKAVISYAIGDRGTVYGSVSSGFRPGGAQERLPARCTPEVNALGLTLDDTAQYKADKLWNYEIGVKNNFANGRLAVSAAGFQIDWKDIQQATRLEECGYPLNTNAGKARIRGGEFEMSGQPFVGVPFTVQLGIGYLDAVLQDPGVSPRAPNSRLAGVPKWTASASGYYRTPISASADLFLAADYSYSQGAKIDEGDPQLIARPPFHIVNANFGVSFGNSQILVFAKNLLDKRYNLGNYGTNGWDRQDLVSGPYTSAGTYERYVRASVLRPRQIGIQYRLSM